MTQDELVKLTETLMKATKLRNDALALADAARDVEENGLTLYTSGHMPTGLRLSLSHEFCGPVAAFVADFLRGQQKLRQAELEAMPLPFVEIACTTREAARRHAVPLIES